MHNRKQVYGFLDFINAVKGEETTVRFVVSVLFSEGKAMPVTGHGGP
jgi:hypothetical protein